MGSIKIVTEIPGPRSRELHERARSSLGRPVQPGGRVFVASAQGAVVEDVDGNRYLDFIGGVGCLVVGHSHPRVLDAGRQQLEKFSHTDFSVAPYEIYLELSERLSKLCGGDRKVALFNSGAEAVENAVKVAKGATGREGIICFDGAFHGRTLMAMSLTSKEIPYKKGFGPFAPAVHRVPYPGLRGATGEEAITVLEELMKTVSIAGVIIEPVLGEGGFLPAAEGFLADLSQVCARNDALLIADEVQSGYGRTGRFLASQWSDVRADVVILGKSIAAGLPLSAVVSEPRHIDSLIPNALGGTYPGNPVACAMAVATLEVIESEHLVDRALRVGEILRESWQALSDKYGGVVSMRGLGSMIGVELESPAAAADLVSGALQAGVMLMTAGRDGEAIRHLMPLVMTDEQLGEAFEAIEKVLAGRG